MEEVKNRFDEVVRQGLEFVLRLALVLGGLGFASVVGVGLLVRSTSSTVSSTKEQRR